MKIKKTKIGIVGCGAIGSRIAKSVHTELDSYCELSGVFDLDEDKSFNLVKDLGAMDRLKTSLKALIRSSDCIVEAVNAKSTRHIIEQSLKAKRNVLAMSVGKLMNAQDLFQLAKKNNCHILLPSGAIAGVDAVKAASLAKLNKITLTTRKPPSGFRNNPYFAKKKIDLSRIKKETMLFDGNVDTAVKLFPQNINVAAALALACQSKRKMRIRILTSPRYQTNSHEIEMEGEFGKMLSRTDNAVCPDNTKTSYLAVLSGIQTLKQFCTGINIGT